MRNYFTFSKVIQLSAKLFFYLFAKLVFPKLHTLLGVYIKMCDCWIVKFGDIIRIICIISLLFPLHFGEIQSSANILQNHTHFHGVTKKSWLLNYKIWCYYENILQNFFTFSHSNTTVSRTLFGLLFDNSSKIYFCHSLHLNCEIVILWE